MILYLIEDEVECTLVSTDEFLVSRRENPLLKGNICDNWILLTAVGVKREDQFMRLKSTILNSIKNRILHRLQIKTKPRKHRMQINRRNTDHQNATERLSIREFLKLFTYCKGQPQWKEESYHQSKILKVIKSIFPINLVI